MLPSRKRKPRKDDNPDLFGQPPEKNALPIFNAEDAVEFILAGKAKITLRSEKTGHHYTYKIRAGDAEGRWFVSRLTAGTQYRYLGTIFEDGFRATRESEHYRLKWLRESFEAFDWFWRRLNVDRAIPRGVTLFHAGRCAACGVELTDPVSIKRGFGPECAKKKLRRPFMYVR